MSETTKASIKFLASFLTTAAGAAMVAITSAGQDDLQVFKRPSVWLAILVAVGPMVAQTFTKGPQEARAIDAEQKEKAEEKAFVKVATMTGNLPIPPDPRL